MHHRAHSVLFNPTFGSALFVPQLSDVAIRAAKPTDKSFTIWDDATPGFGCRVYAGGAKSFIVLIGPGRRQTIGRYPMVSLSDARTAARRILAEKILGRVKPTHTALEDAVKAFLLERAKTLRGRTVADYTRLLGKHYPYGRASIASITPRQIAGQLRNLPLAERHHAFAAGRAFFRFCVSEQYLDRSPMADMEPPRTAEPRERVLAAEELAAVYRTAIAGKTHFHRIIALCLLTGQRRGEIARLERSWLKDGTITIPAEIAKNGRLHAFPIGPTAASVLEAVPFLSDRYFFPAAREQVKGKPATVFNGWGKPKAAFDRESRINDWTIHDLRRCVSTGMAAIGVQQVVVEKLLNHVSGGSQSQIARVYNRHQYFDEMRDAIVRWEGFLHTLAARA